MFLKKRSTKHKVDIIFLSNARKKDKNTEQKNVYNVSVFAFSGVMKMFSIFSLSLSSTLHIVIATTDWICVILFILGFIGNLLGLVVFSSRRFRCCSTYAVLALTSFSLNLICIIRYSLLLHSTTRRWLSDKIVSVHWLTCKIFRLSSSFRVLAAWVTVFWVIERFSYVTSRLHLLSNRREKLGYLEKYKFVFMIIIALIMVIIVTGPTVVFFSPNLSK